MNKKKITLVSLVSLIGTFYAQAALAICPVCVIGVSGGVGLTRWLKIDDTITGLWIGGMTVAIIMWTIQWLDKKNIKFPFRNALIIILSYATVIWPLRSIEVIGDEYNTIWGMDKLILTIFIGSIVFYGFEKWYRAIRFKNGGSLFRYQKVVWAWIPLIILSVFFYFMTK